MGWTCFLAADRTQSSWYPTLRLSPLLLHGPRHRGQTTPHVTHRVQKMHSEMSPRTVSSEPSLVYKKSHMFRMPKHQMERETGFEPATNSLEGCDSTPELLPRVLSSQRTFVRRAATASKLAIHLEAGDFWRSSEFWWRRVDSNHRRLSPADLQSAAIVHSATPPELAQGLGSIVFGAQRPTVRPFVCQRTLAGAGTRI